MKSYIIVCLIAVLLACILSAGCQQDDNCKVTGKVILADDTLGITASVGLYNPSSAPDFIEENAYEYPQCGAVFNEGWIFDHRLKNPIKTATCSPSGDFSLNNVSKGYYIAVFQAEGYGWRYSAPFNVEGDVALNEIELYPIVYPQLSISADETWLSGHQYYVQDSVRVEQVAVLTIESGVWVVFASGMSKLSALGSVIAEGEENDWIRFTSSQPLMSKADWNYIALNNDNDSTSAFKYSLIEYANTGITLNSCKAALNNIVVRHCYYGISVFTSQTPQISRCTIYDCRTGISAYNDMRVDSALVADCDEIGLAVYVSAGWIYDSIFQACSLGFKEDRSPYLIFEHNLITDNTVGLDMESGSQTNLFVQYNHIVDNEERGMYCYRDSYPNTHYNNFIDNAYNIYCYGQIVSQQPAQDEDISAENNYWGTTSSSEISAAIRDGNTPGAENWLGLVLFEPFLTEMEPTAGPR